MDAANNRVVVGMDPHKRSVTIEVMNGDETVLGGGRFGTDPEGYAEMARYVSRFPDRVWAIEGCNGIGRHVAMRLLADGEEVVDVPPKLSARTRAFATGQGRKTDATDAHSVALVGTRMAGLRPVVNDEKLAVLRILIDRRSLGEGHTRMVPQLRHLLLELIPGGAKKDLSAAQAKGSAGQGPTSRRGGQDPAPGRRRADRRPGADLRTQEGGRQGAHRTGQGHRHQPDGPARDRTLRRGPVAGRGRRHHPVPDRGHFASWNGTAPIDASSGDNVRHRLSRAGNRQINRVLHIMATVQLRNPTEGRAYYDRRKADGKTSTEAMRCLKRRLSDMVFKRMLDDAIAHAVNDQGTGPGGQRGNDSDSSATGSHPRTGSSDKPLPGPVITKPTTPLRRAG